LFSDPNASFGQSFDAGAVARHFDPPPPNRFVIPGLPQGVEVKGGVKIPASPPVRPSLPPGRRVWQACQEGQREVRRDDGALPGHLLSLPSMHRTSSQHPSEGSGASASSSATVLRCEVHDVTGATVEIALRKGSQQRLVAPLPPQEQAWARQVVEQARDSQAIELLSPASAGNLGMAQLPVTLDLGGTPHSLTAFLYFSLNGAICKIEASDESYVNVFETGELAESREQTPSPSASDGGGAASSAVSATGPAPSPARTASPALGPFQLFPDDLPPGFKPLRPVTPTMPRTDIRGDIQRIPVNPGVTRYRYGPDPAVNHGILVEIEPGETMYVKLVHVDKRCRDTLGSGTDMALGIASCLNHEGVAVRRVRARWLDETGVDAQYRAFENAIASGQSEQEAAFDSFTGRIARLFEFTQVDVVRGLGEIDLMFTRGST
jgi:hypothetical protein